jgi:CHASE3 domain sensor protein
MIKLINSKKKKRMRILSKVLVTLAGIIIAFFGIVFLYYVAGIIMNLKEP